MITLSYYICISSVYILQLSMAVAQALTDKFHEKWSRLAAVEKLLALDEDPISRIVELCNE